MSRFCRGLASYTVILLAAGLMAAPALADDVPRAGTLALADELFDQASRDPLRADNVQRLGYRLHWTSNPELSLPGRVVSTHIEKLPDAGPDQVALHRFAIDFLSDADAAPLLHPDVWSAGGVISNISVTNEAGGIARLVFDLDPGAEQQIELHAALTDNSRQHTETWLFRWTPE